MSPPVVTLLSDFGAGSGYPAQMKGAVLTARPDAVIVDLSHQVAPYDVLGAALLLEECAPRFPPHAVHCAVVDPGVGTARRPMCLVDAAGRRFVGPDNGLFTPFLEGGRGYLLSDPAVVPEPGSATFHGRDLFAPVAAWLAGGGEAAELGPPIADPVRLAWPTARRQGGELHGECLAADPFGNVVTSIRASDLHAATPVRVRVAGRSLRLVRTYGEGRPGEPLALVGSSGRLEIAVREGSAAALLGLGRGAPIVVRSGGDDAREAIPVEWRAMSQPDPENRRRAARLQHELPVTYRTVGSFLSDWATDISQRGLFINTRNPLPVGTEVKLIIQIPGAAFPYDMVGRVARVVPLDAKTGAPGMGVEFVDLDGAKREHIQAFVEQLRRELGS